MLRPSWTLVSALGLALGCGSDEPGPGIAPPPPDDEGVLKAPSTVKAPNGKKLVAPKPSEISLTPSTK
jgi:hypothetical protein